MSLRKTVFDTATVSSVNVVRLLAQLLAVPLLARFLSPADYGIVAMAMPFIVFAMVIADAGIGMSLVRTPASERIIWSTCFWLSVLLGFALALGMAALAPLAAWAFNEPRLSPIVMALACVVFAQAIISIPGASLQQSQRFKVLAVIEIIAVMTGIGTAVLIAIHNGGAWALVGQQLAFYAVRVISTFWFAPFRPLMIFDVKSVREHLIFGRNVLCTNIVGFFTRSIDNLVIGKVLASAAVGIYSMAFQFARIPMMLVSGPLQYVLYAQLAKVKDDTRAIQATFLLTTRVLAIMIFPVMGMVAVAYHPVFTLLLSEKWAASGRIFMLVAPACAWQAVNGLCATIALVLARTDIQIKTSVEFGVIWVLTLLAAVWFGLQWTAVAYNIAVILYSPRSMMLTLPLIDCSLAAYWRVIRIPLMVTLAIIAVFYELQHALLPGNLMQLGLAIILAGMGVVASSLTQHISIKEEMALWRLAFQ